jgi:2-keto-3-deoxy-L-rhamnonate aldolase RhmA
MVFEFFTPALPQLMHLAGCEFVIYDMEHTGVSHDTLRTQAALCRGLPLAPLARAPSSDYHHIARLLDIGMKGVMVPMVESADQARAIVSACRYPPDGRRGAAFGFAHDDFEQGAPADKIAHANAQTLVIAQVETERGLGAAREIASVEGIDVIWIGQFDLSNFLGVPGGFKSRAYLDAVHEIKAAAKAAGKATGILAIGVDAARQYAAEGFHMIAVGTDHGLLMDGVRTALKAART